ncbi:potassium channel subfamily K member 4-like [Gigantopelta aegis]|uniref:potassium channel subfamily K member 4-like n=1 Tax=Gigantopelta aegis TaxID=1735272 RepID=UPI001B88B705|nr:potassium channel subfamily K member 4-like [Gigantopelta aegis]
MDNSDGVNHNAKPVVNKRTLHNTSSQENRMPATGRVDHNTSSLDNRRTAANNMSNNTPSLENRRSAADNRAETNTTSLDNRPKNRKRKKTPKENKKKKKGTCCSCCTGDRVSGTDTNMESDTDAERDSESPHTGCCSCCFGSKNKKRNRKREKAKKNSCISCCKKLTTFLFSHIGLCSLVVAYSVFGGFVFMKLEAPHEVLERNSVAVIRLEKVSELWNITEELNVLHQQNWSAIAERVFLDFQFQVFHATKHRGWDGKDGETELQWSFAGALLYSVTVITTIGYGHIAPKTPYGRLVTIFYALIGIPLTLLCLANMGSFLGNCFRCFYKRLCQFLMWLCCPPQSRSKTRTKRTTDVRYSRDGLAEEIHPLRAKPVDGDNDVTIVVADETAEEEKPAKEEPVRVPIIVSFIIVSSYIFGGAVIFSWWEKDWDYLIGSYFCFITLSTIGFGDYVPGSGLNSWSSQEKLIFCCLYLVFGLSVIAMCFNLMQEEVRAKCRWLGVKLGFLDEDES